MARKWNEASFPQSVCSTMPLSVSTGVVQLRNFSSYVMSHGVESNGLNPRPALASTSWDLGSYVARSRVACWFLAALFSLVISPKFARADVVINEVFMVPDSGPCPCAMPGCEPIRPLIEYVELWNRGPGIADLGNWWFCDQPTSMNYFRLRQIPQGSGMPFSPGIVLGPGDFLVIKFGCLVQFPGYSTRPNNSGTTTHTTTLPLTITSDLQIPQTNFSIWDHSPPSNPDFPSFDQPQFMRDFVAWSQTGIYVGAKRGCVAANPVANLWPTEIGGNCQTLSPTPQFVAVDSSLLLMFPGSSINYSGRFANDPTDYFIAMPTEGERNAMPGDLDDDLDMDNDDFALFESCFGSPVSAPIAEKPRGGLPPPCELADLDHNFVVDCNDWQIFGQFWVRYSTLPAPILAPCEGCLPGDFNGDKLVDGLDLQGFVNVMLGNDNSPEGACAADINTDGFVDCSDVTPMIETAIAAKMTGCLVGDVNGDGRVDGLDVQPFLSSFGLVLCGQSEAFCAADANPNGVIDFDDIEPFVAALLP